MPLDLDLTKCWHFTNDASGALAEALHKLPAAESKEDMNAILGLLDEARRRSNQATGHIDLQIAAIAKRLETR